MSLVSHLRSPSSPVSAYLDGVSPWLAETQGGSRTARSMSQALGLAQLARVKTVVPPLPGVDAALSGTAIDFRVRIALGGFNPLESAAALGVAGIDQHTDEIDNGQHRTALLTEAFFIAMQILEAPSDDAELDRACILFAYCEQVYRAGAAALAGSLGERLDEAEDALDIALSISESSLSDLRGLMEANSDQISAWRELVGTCERFEPNPAFSGSMLVGGADADWLIRDTLIESKAYAKLTIPTLRGFIRQLLGYVMLDLDDALGIRSVGLWLPRQGVTKTWSLERLLGGDPDELLPKLRAGFRTATQGKQLAGREKVTERRQHQILADNRHTPRRMLADLALSEDHDIRFRVGRNPVTPEETLRQLATDRYARAREGVAHNENAPVGVLATLSQDTSVSVRRAAVANSRTPAESTRALGAGEPNEAPVGAVLLQTGRPGTDLQIRQDRDHEALDTQWFLDFLIAAHGGQPWERNPRLPVPKASQRWALKEGRSLEVPDCLRGGLPDPVKADLMHESRPAWVRRRISRELPISEPAVRERLLSDADPEIRWTALQRTIACPDDSLAELLGRLAGDKQERTRFRTDGDGLSRWERYRTPADYNKETLILIAAHPSTPQAALTELMMTKSPDVLVALTDNPALPAEELAAVLPRVTAIRSHEIRARLAASPRIPALAALALADDRSLDVRLALARNDALSSEVVEKLVEDSELSVRLAAVVHPQATAELAHAIIEPLLSSAADEDLLSVLRAMDRRDDLQLPQALIGEALDRLSKSRVREPDMRQIAGADIRSQATTLSRLARSADESVRAAVAGNPSVPRDALVSLAVDADPRVRSAAAGSDTLEMTTLSALARDEDSEVRRGAARNPRLDPVLLSKLLSDEDVHVRSAARRNPSTRPEDLDRANAEWERKWLESAPSREELEERVANRRAEVRMEVAYDSRTPADFLKMLGGERRSAQVRRAVAANPNTPAEVLASLADDKDEEVRQAVAFNIATPPNVLVSLAGRSVDLAILVALNPSTSLDVIRALSQDSDPLVGHIATEVGIERAAMETGISDVKG